MELILGEIGSAQENKITSHEQQEFRENTDVRTNPNPFFHFTEPQLSRGMKWRRCNPSERGKEKHVILQNIVNAYKKPYLFICCDRANGREASMF